MAESSFARSRAEISDLLSGAKWVILLALVVSAILFVPEQIRELYRIVHADRSIKGFVSLYASVLAMGAVTWLAAVIVVRAALAEIDTPKAFTVGLARILPLGLGALPLLGSASAHVLAQPGIAGERLSDIVKTVGSPWEQYDLLISGDVGSGLVFGAIGLTAAAVLLALPGIWLGARTSGRWVDLLVIALGNWKALILSALAIAAFSYVYIEWPIEVARTLGVFGILAIFTLCITASTVHLSLLTLRHNFPFLPLMFAAAVVFSLFDLNDNHTLVEAAPEFSTGAERREEPALDQELIERWYQSRPDKDRYGSAYPVYVVAAQGGGIYAAYQTAVFLARMQDLCPSFRHHVFAISSVSGGSLGAAAFVAALEDEAEATPPAAPPAATPTGDAVFTAAPCPAIARFVDPKNVYKTKGLDEPGPVEKRVRALLGADFIAPLTAATLFPDFTQRFLPFPVPAFDRARALEQSFVAAAEKAIGGDRNPMRMSFLAHWEMTGSKPALLINATDSGSGRRIVIAPFAFSKTAELGLSARSFANYPFWLSKADDKAATSTSAFEPAPEISLATAAGVSARFPWITPAATVVLRERETGRNQKLRLVDGGYVDNSGVETALDLNEEMRPFIDKRPDGYGVPLKLTMIVLSGGDYPKRTSYGLGEIMEPIRGLLSARQSRSYVAIERAARLMPPDILASFPRGKDVAYVTAGGVQRVLLENPFYELPLGWALSRRSRDIVERQSGRYWECQPDTRFNQSFRGLSAADCVQMLVHHQLSGTLASAGNFIAAVRQAEKVGPDGKPFAQRTDYEAVAGCYRKKSMPNMTFAQRSAIVSLLQVWDEHPEWQDDRYLAYILGSVAHETGKFSINAENAKYNSASRLMTIWPSKFPTLADAEPYVGNEEKLLNFVYGGRYGNVEPGDGFKYRGRGLVQLFGRENYRRFGQMLGIDLESDPNLVGHPGIGARVVFNVIFPNGDASKLSRYFNATTEDWVGARRIMAGGQHGAEAVKSLSLVFLDCIKTAGRR
ncbi:MAG: hypothetical protein NW216_05150 [Hyphomicrobium sp.]|nr:hypothetical protein [Hyphomicrobium sp.]